MPDNESCFAYRAQQLIDLGFEWSAKDPSHKCWEDRFQELCDYKAKFGSTLVPMGWKENPRVGSLIVSVPTFSVRNSIGSLFSSF